VRGSHDLALLREHGLEDHLILVENGDAGAMEKARDVLAKQAIKTMRASMCTAVLPSSRELRSDR